MLESYGQRGSCDTTLIQQKLRDNSVTQIKNIKIGLWKWKEKSQRASLYFTSKLGLKILEKLSKLLRPPVNFISHFSCCKVRQLSTTPPQITPVVLHTWGGCSQVEQAQTLCMWTKRKCMHKTAFTSQVNTHKNNAWSQVRGRNSRPRNAPQLCWHQQLCSGNGSLEWS